MGAADAVHPTEQILNAYSLGKLDQASALSVDRHLDSCTDCRNRVAAMSPDSFLGRLRGAQGQQDKSAVGWAHSSISPNDRDPASTIAPPPDTMPPGLADHRDYQVIRELGRGGMGVVYLVQNRLLGRNEVLKVMGRHIMDRPGLLARFLGEMRAVAQLHRPNIVTAYSAFRLGESILFAMEYVDGLDLARLVKAKGPLPVVNAFYFVNQAAQGLQHAHELGMVHRDIKPGNLMLTYLGKRAQIKVLDFGLAIATREVPVDGGLTNSGQALGTPDYMGPEQIRDAQKADIRADIYSLGCTLYYLLSGGPPFHAENLWDLYQAHHSMDAKLLNFVRPNVPSELAAVVAKMMAKEPERRFQTPADVAQALAPFFKKGGASPRVADAEVSRVGQTAGRWESPATRSVAVEPASSPAPAPPRSVKKPNRKLQHEPAWESLIEFKETETLKEEPAIRVSKSRTERPRWLLPAAAVVIVLIGIIATWAVVGFNGKAPSRREIEHNERRESPLAIQPVEDQVEIPATPTRGDSGPLASGAVANHAGMRANPTKADSLLVVDRSQFSKHTDGWRREADVLSQANATSPWDDLLFGDERWTDYEFSVDVLRVEGRHTFSLLFRKTAEENGFECKISGDEDGCSFNELDGRGSALLDDKVLPLLGQGWWTVRVEVNRHHFVCFLGDKRGESVKIFDEHNRRHANGRVGLRTWFSAYRFKNIKVTAPDGSVVWEGLPAIETPKEQESPRLVAPSEPALLAQERFFPFFNGTDLTGWVTPEDKSLFTVENGEIVGRTKRRLKKNEFLATEKSYGDFVLKAKVKIHNGNSGIQFRSKRSNDGAVLGPQADVAFDQWGVLCEEHGRGDLERYPLDKATALLNPDGWNEFVITAARSHVTIDLNGTRINDLDDPKFNNEGIVALQIHVWPQPMEVRFKDIEIKEILTSSRAADPRNHGAAPETVNADSHRKVGSKAARSKGNAAITTASGLQYRDIDVGNGPSPKDGQECVVHYAGWLWQNGNKGKVYDSSRDAGRKPFSFTLHRNKVIDGWEEGVASMKVGGTRELLIPAHLASDPAAPAKAVSLHTPHCSLRSSCSTSSDGDRHCHAVFFATRDSSKSIRAVSTRNSTALFSITGVVNP